MSSQKRIDASRANGAKSKGPKTPEGKAISSQNALRHGLTATTILIDGELPERFETLLAGLVAEYHPETESENQLVETMAVAKWRQLRVWGLETTGHSEEIRNLVASSETIAAKGQAERAFYAFREMVNNSNAAAILNKHEVRFERLYNKALQMLTERRERKEVLSRNRT